MTDDPIGDGTFDRMRALLGASDATESREISLELADWAFECATESGDDADDNAGLFLLMALIATQSARVAALEVRVLEMLT